jgi:hypothetical protein
MYLKRNNASNSSLYYRYTFGNNAPGMGAICPTVAGNSGGAAVADSRTYHVLNKSDPRCIAGILVRGQQGSPNPWDAGVEHHETFLPSTAIIKNLDDHFTSEFTLDGNPVGTAFNGKWFRHYNVTILETGDPPMQRQ